jgi:hypothetical protein
MSGFLHKHSERAFQLPGRTALLAESPNKVETIMTYEMALELQQAQRYEHSLIAEAEHQQQEYQQERRNFGPGRLCACGMKQAQDCDCPF